MDIVGGAQPEKALFIREPKEGYVQLYQTRDYGENPVPVYIPQKYATKTTDEGDILLARYGGSLGKVFRAHKGAYNVAFAMVFSITHRCVNFTKEGFCSRSRYLLRKSPQVICPVTI